ncbi:MAG: (2Fe-2S) ferredoxin domain-containing protein [Treponema sp.]|jgi:NADH:ubiquinone oxidoreductase subunit E|nr:(2Fe-2S) ferredoxin domain-containing protein [Treponema sp.]
MKDISVCMGSSCFSRGSAAIAALIQSYVKEHALEQWVNVSGCLCGGKCKNGPNVRIDGTLFSHIVLETLPALLDQKLADIGGN